jgi:hypothetical protein
VGPSPHDALLNTDLLHGSTANLKLKGKAKELLARQCKPAVRGDACAATEWNGLGLGPAANPSSGTPAPVASALRAQPAAVLSNRTNTLGVYLGSCLQLMQVYVEFDSSSAALDKMKLEVRVHVWEGCPAACLMPGVLALQLFDSDFQLTSLAPGCG